MRDLEVAGRGVHLQAALQRARLGTQCTTHGRVHHHVATDLAPTLVTAIEGYVFGPAEMSDINGAPPHCKSLRQRTEASDIGTHVEQAV